MEKVLNIIQENSKKTGNGSGISAIQVREKSGLEIRPLVRILQDLINQKRIYVREGINHQLLFAL